MDKTSTKKCGILSLLMVFLSLSLQAQYLASAAPSSFHNKRKASENKNEHGTSMKEALRKTERKFGISIAYRSELLEKMSVPTVLEEKTSPEAAMDMLVSNTGLKYKKNSDNYYIIYEDAKSENQERTITGRVTDENNSPVAGVNVTVKGTPTGTSSTADGTYSITVKSQNDTLIFHYVGYIDFIAPLAGRTTLNVQLKPDQVALGEVVITAAGIERNTNTLGYSVTTLGGDDLAQKNEPDPIRALSGKVAGVNIQGGGGVAGGSTNITIRGNSSLGNNNQPLYVVDGIPFDNSTFAPPSGGRSTQGNQSTGNRAYDIDPNNIASLTVLKGAAAAALYGSRAANGAIIITTKAAGSRSRKGTEITVSSSYSAEEIAGLPDYQHLYGQGTNNDYREGVYGSSGSAYSTRPTIPHPLAALVSAADFPEIFEADGRTPIQVPYQSYAGKSQGDFFRTGGVFDNAISINSGTEKGNFTVGLGRSQNDGMVPGNNVTRTSLNVGGNIRMDNKFYASGTLNYVMTDRVSPPIGGSGDIMSNLYYLPTSIDLTGLPYTNPNTGANVYSRAGTDNPYWSIENSPSTSNVDRYYGNFVLGFDPLEWLNIQNSVGFNAYTDRRLDVLGKGSWVYANGSMIADNIYRQELDNTLLITATKDFGTDYSLRVILGNNVNQRLTQRSVFYGDNIITAGINDISNTSTIVLGNLPNNRAKIMQRYYAFFGDVTLDYKTWGSLNLVARNDVSSTLPKENRSYLYGGANGSFIFTEAFDIKNAILSFGNVRLGYTRVGNEASPYLTQNVYTANVATGGIGAPFSNGVASNVSTMTLSDIFTNSNLQPEFITEFEVGTEMRFFNSKITFDFTYYHKKSTSQIFTVSSAPSTGYTDRIINLGQTSNKGFEIGLNATPFRSTTGVTWDINANFTKNKNMVDDLGGYAQLVYGNNVHIAGQPYGMIYRGMYARDDEGNILVNPQTGKPIASSTAGPIADPQPRFFAGLNNSLSYKNFSLDVLFDWKEGGAIFAGDVGQAMARGVTRDTEDRMLLYIGPGVLGNVNTLEALRDENGNKIPNNTAIPVIDYYFSGGYGPGGIAEGTVFDATVFRLREISLGYSIPKNLLAKTPFGSAFISISGRNLWYKAPNFPKYMNYDPEVSTGAANNAGADAGGVPTSRRYGVNLRFSF